jgi:hypothetical protein
MNAIAALRNNSVDRMESREEAEISYDTGWLIGTALAPVVKDTLSASC